MSYSKQKQILQKKLKLKTSAKIALVVVTSELLENSDADFTKNTIQGLVTLPIQMIILGSGVETSKLANQFQTKIRILPNNLETQTEVLKSADIVLISDHQNKSLIQQAWENGCVPIVHECESVTDYNPVTEEGNAFVYHKRDVWNLFAGVIRALETYRLPYDWKGIIRNGKKACRAI